MQILPPLTHHPDSVMMNLVTNPSSAKFAISGFFKNNTDSSFYRVVSFLEGDSHIGWRGYLQNALEGMNKHWKYILISIIW
jgi:hypothetical protein